MSLTGLGDGSGVGGLALMIGSSGGHGLFQSIRTTLWLYSGVVPGGNLTGKGGVFPKIFKSLFA